jgi:hypothetical protein
MVDLGEGSTFARLCLVLAGDFAGEGDEPTERPKPKSGYVQPTLAAHNCGYHHNPGAPSIRAMVHDLPTRDPEQGPYARIAGSGSAPSETAVLLKPDAG